MLTHHIVRNAIVTVISVFGVNLAYLVGGTVLIENVFSLPGLGSLLVKRSPPATTPSSKV